MAKGTFGGTKIESVTPETPTLPSTAQLFNIYIIQFLIHQTLSSTAFPSNISMSSRVPSSDSTKEETYKIIHRLNANYAEQPASYLRTHLLFPLREIS